MAKRNDENNHKHGSSATALAEKEHGVSDMTVADHGDERPVRRETTESAEPTGAARGFFDIYKPSQGYYTRIWSGLALGVLVCWMAYFLYEKLELVGTGHTTKYVQVGVAVGVILVFGLFGYWLLGLNRRIGDFLIATEGEMKKVNWTSRKEIIGSTRVVCFVLISLAALLFVVDLLFMGFFNAIGVLKGEGLFGALKGIF